MYGYVYIVSSRNRKLHEGLKIMFANCIHQTTAMPISMISIKDWVENYRVEYWESRKKCNIPFFDQLYNKPNWNKNNNSKTSTNIWKCQGMSSAQNWE